MMIWAVAVAVAVLLDATPKTEMLPTQDKTATVRLAAPPAPLLTVAVTVECTARANGLVEGCRVLGETHPGLGFAEAALALMRDAEVEPGLRDYQFARTIQFTP